MRCSCSRESSSLDLGTDRALVPARVGGHGPARRAGRRPAEPTAHTAAARGGHRHAADRRRRPDRARAGAPAGTTSSPTSPARSTRWPTTLERSKGLEQQFLLSVSHDLRTPLTSIRGYAEAIADGTDSATRRPRPRSSWPSRGGSNAWSATCSTSPGSSRGSSRSISEPVDLVDVAAATVDGFRPEARDERHRSSRCRAAPSAGRSCSADPDRLAQVVANLVENALKYAAHSVVGPVTSRRQRRDRSSSTTTARASRPRTSPTCSSGSTCHATNRCARRPARGSASRSSASSSTRWAARSLPRPRHPAAPACR